MKKRKPSDTGKTRTNPGRTDLADSGFDADWFQHLRRNTLQWYSENRRELPWRRHRDPYRIWVSEIMLQQTTVETVRSYFDRFLAAFPTVADLAAADLQDVLRLWEGLGYYSRARNLHAAAGVIVDEFGGTFPDTQEKLQQLPGIGRYTAAAIASFAFGLPAGVLEANTVRLYSRLSGLTSPVHTSAAQRSLWNFADAAVCPDAPGDFNQAVMDLGSQVCTPTGPCCSDCPLRNCCRAFAESATERIPVRRPSVKPTELTEVSVIVPHPSGVLMRQRTDGEWWSGLWDFVRFRVDANAVTTLSRAVSRVSPRGGRRQRQLFDDSASVSSEELSLIRSEIRKQCGVPVSTLHPLMKIRHAVTRYRIDLLCLIAEVTSGRIRAQFGNDFRTVSLSEADSLPMTSTARRQYEKYRSA